MMFYAQGIVGPLVRLSEPAFRRTISESIKKDLASLFCFKKSFRQIADEEAKEVKDSEMAPLFLYLASSLNVELVYIILKGITSFTYIKSMEETIGEVDERTRRKREKLDSRLEHGNIYLNLTKIKIKNFDKWS